MAFIPQYILILALLIVIDYTVGLLLQKTKQKRTRKLLLLVSICANVGILFFFKYVNFFQSNVEAFASLFHLHYPAAVLRIILPIGLSFHTFQSLSYIIEVYKKRQKAERNFFIYALYVMFYPQLVAGPIERPQQMLPQFHKKHTFSEENLTEGLRRILVGLFKKMIIADHLALLVNQVYGNPHAYIGLPLVIATVAFAFQIYCDFSGYSDIAVGSARVMGYTLMENFNLPYVSVSIAEFWRRWHISLYSWFRDYIYIPLGGNRVGTLNKYRNILITFTLSGLWHGTSWLFVIWGALQGIYMIINDFAKGFDFSLKSHVPQPLKKILQIIFTFTLVCIAWVFFRAATLHDALYILSSSPKGLGGFVTNLFTGNTLGLRNYILRQGNGLGPTRDGLLIIIFSLLILALIESVSTHNSLKKTPGIIRWGIYIIITISIINFGIVERIPFIYFQF
jgi:D-alanyl-lipoteichoic acid acyltransferase DltB (MBOAT superfamily)